MQDGDMLEWMLEEAKKRPMEIHHDFETRFRVWTEQIIPDRINAIRACNGDSAYVDRMKWLTIDDADRLVDRIHDEGNEMAGASIPERVGAVLTALEEAETEYFKEERP